MRNKNKYPDQFSAAHKTRALKLGFSRAQISTFGNRACDSRIELDYEVDDELYTVTWQLAGPGGGFPGALMFVGRGAATRNDSIRDQSGNACHDFASFADFLEYALEDIHRRAQRAKEARLRRQADDACSERLAHESAVIAEVMSDEVARNDGLRFVRYI